MLGDRGDLGDLRVVDVLAGVGVEVLEQDVMAAERRMSDLVVI